MGLNDFGSSFPSRPERANVDLPRDTDGNTYLHELIRKDAPLSLIREAVEKLGANVNAVNKRNLPPLGVAIQSAKPEIVAGLIDLGAELYFPVAKDLNFNAAYLAADTGRNGALDVVLSHGGGAHVNSPGIGSDGRSSPWTALHIAVKNYHYEMIDPLLNAGALLNAEAGFDKVTPLFLAITNNTESGIRSLLNAGADLEGRQSTTGRTPLQYAVYNKQGTAVRVLLDYGANANAEDNAGQTPLLYAAENGDSRIIELLLSAHADIDHRRNGNNSETALMRAAQKGSSEAVKALLKAGANPILTDAFNKTALKYAEDNYQHGTRFVLEEAEKKALQAHFENSYKKYRP